MTFVEPCDLWKGAGNIIELSTGFASSCHNTITPGAHRPVVNANVVNPGYGDLLAWEVPP